MKRARSPSPPLHPINPSQDVYHSAPIEDRASIFVAHYSPTLSAKVLQSHKDFKKATHRIAAWRVPGKQRTLQSTASQTPISSGSNGQPQKVLYETGFDDDGEKYAGKRVLRVLEDMKAEGAVVVARWYGGTLLGPVRFAHIEGVAREAIRLGLKASKAAKINDDGFATGEAASKRPKSNNQVDDEETRKRLVVDLSERDESITTLRKLLAEKKGEDLNSVSPMKGPNYGNMPLAALKRLDQARDATIAFLLKNISEAETERAARMQPSGEEVSNDIENDDLAAAQSDIDDEELAKLFDQHEEVDPG
jgi:putative IMPACT (imprinted ancient) family translation regulator